MSLQRSEVGCNMKQTNTERKGISETEDNIFRWYGRVKLVGEQTCPKQLTNSMDTSSKAGRVV
jgi:hypothetical protein